MKMHHEEIRQAARSLYLKRYTPKEIAETLNVPLRTVYHWCATGDWDALLTHEGAEEAVARRLTLLAERDPKTPGEMREVDLLVATLERLQRLRLREGELARQQPAGMAGGADGACAPSPDGEGPAPSQGERRPRRGRPIKNDVTALTPALFQEKLHARYFDYQRQLRAALTHRNRMLLKARQIGV